MPGIVSNSLLEEADARVGDTLVVGLSSYSLALNVVAAVDYFPTLYQREQPFVVVDLKTFNHHSNLHSPAPVGGSDELWVGLGGPPGEAGAITAALNDGGLRVRKVYLAADMVSQNVEQPLVSAGWGGLLVLMFLALALASASGVMLFSYVDTKGRQTEFAVLRTLGATRKQLNGVVWFSLLVVAACGIGLGTWAGRLVGASLLPLMEVAEQGVRVTPPLVLQTNWVTLAVTYAMLAVVTAGTVAWLAWLARRLEVQQVLRIGEAAR
jgi:predicted lysophospholipase L1 biosynthesis ABC-type transport system permease subunit